ncbi:EF-hand domain-containing protein [Oleomonas cavernae]|nr:hypothetical protein [Oleomonas cavernae]
MTIRSSTVAGALLAGFLTLGGLTACGGDSPSSTRHGPPRTVLSPPPLRPPPVSLAGEVLDSTPDVACWPATHAWFKATDTNGNGKLELPEIQADSARFFARIDANGDHALTSSELTAYREAAAPSAYRDQPAPPARRSAGDSPMTADQPPSPGSAPPPGSRTERRDSGLLAQPDPVMAADTNLDFRVTPEELADRVKSRVAKLDTNQDGALDSAELAAYCPPE